MKKYTKCQIKIIMFTSNVLATSSKDSFFNDNVEDIFIRLDRID